MPSTGPSPQAARISTRALPGEWFADGMVNTCWNAIDRHVAAGHGDRLAVIHDSPMTGSVSRLTYAQLQDQVARLAGVLAARGIGKGDRVIIYMPMIPEALQAMLACAGSGHPFGRLRRVSPRMNWRCASTTPSPARSSPQAAGWSRVASSPTSR